MEKIKSLLNPGKQTDDEVMYGSGSPDSAAKTTQNTNLTGEGSHFDHTGNETSTGGSHNTASGQAESRQHMPGRYPTGDPTKQTVHNPYTVREVDPRVGGSTQPSSGHIGSSTTGDYPGERQKGLNVASAEDTSHGYQNSGRSTETSARPTDYTGTTPSGNNDNYHGAPTGTAIGDDGRGSHRGSAVNLPPSKGAAAAGMMTDNDATNDYSLANKEDDSNKADDYEHRGASTVSDPVNSGQRGQQDYQNQQSSTTQDRRYGAVTGQGLREERDTTQQYPEQQKGHHNVRNAAVGGAAVGYGAHEYIEQKDHKAHGGKYDNYAGNDGNNFNQNTTTGKHGADTTRDTHGRDRFYGKEAALAGAGGVAYTQIAGSGQVQHGTRNKPYTENEAVSGTHERTGASGPASQTSGPHKSNFLNKWDPSVDENYSATATTGSRGVSRYVGASDGHEGIEGHDVRGNRAAVAGAGMPLGDDAATQRYTEHSHGFDNPAYAKTGSRTGTNAGGVGSANQKQIPLDGVELPRGNQYGQDVKDPRYGLPMAAAGVTAAEAEALRAQDDDLIAKHAAHDTGKKEKRRASLLGFLHRDKNKKYTKEEEAEFARQERQHNASGHAETDKPLPPNPTGQGQTATGYTQGQQLNLTDRTRHSGDTTTAPGYSGGMVDERGNPISDRGVSATGVGGEIPYRESEYGRGTTASGNNQNYYGAPSGSAIGSTHVEHDSSSPAYPSGGAGDGRDYNTSGGPLHTKVLQTEGGHNVLHKKSHVVHPAAELGESGSQGGATGAGGGY